MNKYLKSKIIPTALAATMVLGIVDVTAASVKDIKADNIPYNVLSLETRGEILQAHNWHSKVGDGIAVNENGPDFTSVGGQFEAGNTLLYKNVDFKNGKFNTMMFTISALSEDNGKEIEVRLDSKDGQLLGTIQIDSSNKERVFKEHYLSIPEISGVKDLVLVFKDAMKVNIDWFTCSEYDGTETEEEFNERMKWFRDARYGQFVHWGAYAEAAGEYKGRKVNYAEWIMNYLGISKEDYANDIAKKFNPTEFNAKELVSLAKEAGQKYLVFTTRHHEGFSMYETGIREFKDYQLMGYGDYKGPDPVAELARECKEQGIKFGTYYTIYDWHDKTQSNYGNNINPDEKEEFKTRLKGQLREIIEKYDTELIWFDGEWPSWWTKEDGREFYRYLRTIKPSLIINNRVGKKNPDDGDYGTPEQEIPEEGLDYDWESCMTLNGTWGYNKYDNNWKSPQTIISNLVDTASKGGNYLLNVGPDQLGRVPEKSAEILKEVGKWIDIYGDSIYGTKMGCYQKLSSGIRSTIKEGKVYLHFTEWNSGDTIKIPSLVNEIKSINIMGENIPVNYTKLKDGLLLELPQYEGNKYNTVIEINVDGMPEAVESSANENLATKATSVVASNYYQNNADYSPIKAVDGNMSTRWATDDNTTKATLDLTFAEPITFTKAMIKPFLHPQKNEINAYNIEYWNGEEWIVGYEGGAIKDQDEVTFAPITSDKIRLNITDALNPSIYEFQLFNEQVYNIEIQSPTSNNILNSGSFTINGISQGGASVEAVILSANGAPVKFQGPVNEDGSYSINVSGIGAGNKDLKVYLKDKDGATVDIAATKIKVRDYGKNLVLGKEVTVSSEYSEAPGYDKTKAIDENLSTRWAPGNGDRTPTMTIDFAERTTFDKVIISEMLDTWVTPNGYRCLKFKLDYSDNGQWKTIHEGTSIGEELTVDFEPVKGEKIRLTILENTSANNYAPANIVEFEVYSTVKNSLVGDLNEDGVITISDLAIVSKNYGTNNEKYDFNNDGVVNEIDINYITEKILSKE